MNKFIEINGIDTRYFDSGEGESVLLFLHGWAAPLEVYKSIFEFLSPHFRVVAPETPGCGKTGDPPKGWNVDEYVDFVLDFCGKLGIKKAVLMGHSFGVRLMIKIMSVKKNVLECEKAVIIDGAGIVPKRGLDYYTSVYSYKTAKKIVGTKIGNFFFGPLWEERREHAGSSDYAKSSDVMKHTLSLVVNEDLKHLMGDIDASVLLIWGEKDDSTPIEDGKTMERLMKNAALAEIKGASHYPFLDNPKLFFEILRNFI